MKVILTKGLIASGKSSWCKEFIRSNPDYIRLSRDDFRTMIDFYSYSEATEKVVTQMINVCMEQAILEQKNIIIDEQHLNETYLNERIQFFKQKGYEIEIKEFPITLHEAISRDAKRSHVIGEAAIKRTWKKYEIQLKQMIERAKPKYPWNHNLPYCVISDIDGTLAHSPNRKIFDFKEVINDECIYPVWSILEKYSKVCDIILLSGRGEESRKETEQWLEKQGVVYKHLFMRKEKDFRPDTIIKTELFNEHIRDTWQPMFVIDDRICVCQTWVDMGLFVINVNQDPNARNPF